MHIKNVKDFQYDCGLPLDGGIYDSLKIGPTSNFPILLSVTKLNNIKVLQSIIMHMT